ncbi:MAG: EFR1 family ferrodoxin, partial [Promethearchaeota archaeon]
HKNYRYFSKKGFSLLGYEKILMPGTDGLAMMKTDAKYVKKVLAKDYDTQPTLIHFIDQIEQQVLKFQSGIPLETLRKKIPLNFWDSIFGWTLRLPYKLMIKKFKSLYRADENCTRCGLCATVCPVNNITLTADGVGFGDKCILCLRCIHQCPVEAIQLGKLTVGKFRWRGPDGKFSPISYMK